MCRKRHCTGEFGIDRGEVVNTFVWILVFSRQDELHQTVYSEVKYIEAANPPIPSVGDRLFNREVVSVETKPHHGRHVAVFAEVA